MALVAEAAFDNSSSLAIDAPESSLDMVFAERAAGVLNQFAGDAPRNQLLVTSNLVEGSLLPSLVRTIPVEQRAGRVLDLLQIAQPTVAVRQYREQYETLTQNLMALGA